MYAQIKFENLLCRIPAVYGILQSSGFVPLSIILVEISVIPGTIKISIKCTGVPNVEIKFKKSVVDRKSLSAIST